MTNAPAVARMFYGLPVGDCARAITPLVPAIVEEAQGRAVPRENLHATLAFVGAVPQDAVTRLVRIGDALPRPSLVLLLDTVGSFRGARVAWIGPSQVPLPLARLHDALARALRADGFAVEERPYHPHVTLARRCGRIVAPRTIEALEWRVPAIVLYESIGAPGGPRYEPRAQWPLAPVQ